MQSQNAKSMKRCACSGVRGCSACADPALRAACEMQPRLRITEIALEPTSSGGPVYAFDPESQSVPGCPEFSGLCLLPELLSEAEAHALISEIERHPFSPAQSGKEKQHFGPRINFKRRKIKPGPMPTLPIYTDALLARARKRLTEISTDAARLLGSFCAADVFVLRYQEQAGSNLDFHIDDTSVYGELIIDLSLESDSHLTFLQEPPNATPRCVQALLPARSLALLYGPARYDWQHAILANNIQRRRTSITLRSLKGS